MTRITFDMDEDKVKPVKIPNVLRKFNTESIMMLERGLLGDLPEKLKPVPPRALAKARLADLTIVKPSPFRSGCLPIIPDSPTSEKLTPSDDESSPQLKKTFSFREKLSKFNFFGKDKDKQEKIKCKTIVEEEKNKEEKGLEQKKPKTKIESKRLWFSKNKDDNPRTMYKRSKSFEFLPKAIDEQIEEQSNQKSDILKRNYSYNFGSSDAIDSWSSNESLDRIADVYYDNDKAVFLKSIKEYDAPESSNANSSMSTVTSASSGINILKTQSVSELLEEFDKAVEMFSENYMSDCEPYTKSDKKPLSVVVTRRNASFSSIPSPKIVKVNRLSEVREDFMKELSEVISAKRVSGIPVGVKTCRRGSVTDWFVLEDKNGASTDENKYRRAQKKPVNRVRRMSSTKYWITPEECAVYSREQRPPLVIPRITQYRPPRRDTRSQNTHYSYSEDTVLQDPAPLKSSVRQYDRLQDWSPHSERSRVELERNFAKANSDSPPFSRINKRLGGSSENLLDIGSVRPNYLQLPASSSGDSLDIEVREREPGYGRHRKSRSLVAPKHRMRSPVPAPRTLLHQPSEATVILEGVVKRTKFSESGKKSKKNWTECYMILTPTGLVFYKDQRTYQATKIPKPVGTPPSPNAPRAELVLPLRNAHLVHCIPMHTRRHARSLVLTVGYDQYLLQDETEEGAKKWLTFIQNVIYKLGPPTLAEEYQPPQYQSSNTDLESLGRTPPVSRHSNRSKQKVGGSSNEDLSDSTEVSIQKSDVRSRLRKFFAKRPAMSLLVEKGIYKDEPVFGRNLEEVCPTTSPRVPGFVVACVKEIEGNEENMSTDGLYRASGNLSQVQKIRLEIDQNNLSVIKNNTDIHVLTGSLKLFFRELKEPLIPCSLFDRVLAACSKKPREAKIKEFRDIVQSLPQCNRDTLKFLLEHLLRVTQYSERNRMHTANLAIVFGPTLLWAPAEQAHNIAIDCIQQNNVVDVLLTDFNEIFAEDNKGKKKA